MEKTIKLNAEQAKALYEKDNDLRHTLLHEFSDKELGIKPDPFTWYDLHGVSGAYVSGIDSSVNKINLFDAIHSNRNVAPTRKDAKSSLARHMLLQLAKHYNDGQTEEEWIDWGDKYQNKWCCFYNHMTDRYEVHPANQYQMPVVYFKRREDLEKCIIDNPDLWKEYLKDE